MKRHLCKAVTYRVLSVVVTTLMLSTAVEMRIALVFGGVDAIVKIGLYVAHEYAWAKWLVRWELW